MIGIQLDGDDEFLETNPNTSISIKLENPILGDGIEKLSPGSYSLPFSIPGGDLSPRNAGKLKNPDVIENNEAYQIQKASIFFDGIPFKSGNLKATESDKQIIESNFTFGLNSISEGFKTARLRSIFAETFLISSSTTKKVYIKKQSAGDYKITLNGKEYTDTLFPDLALQVTIDAQNETLDQPNKWYPRLSFIASGTTPSGLIVDDYIEVKLTQWYTELGVLYQRDCTDQAAELHVQVADEDIDDYLIEGDLGTFNSDLQTFIASYRTGAPTTTKIGFPVLFNASLHSDAFKFYNVINGWDSSGIIENDHNWGLNTGNNSQVRNYNSIQPFAKLKYVLDEIAERFGFTLEGDFYDDPDIQNIFIDNSTTIDRLQNFIGADKFIFFKGTFILNDLLPDISVPDFFKALQTRYNLALYYNELTKKVRIAYREPIAKSTEYDEITFMSSPDPQRKDQRVTGYTLRVPKEEEDFFSLEETKVVGDSEKEYPVGIGRLFRTNSIFVDGGLLEGPFVSRANGATQGFRIFHDSGIVNNGSYDYPQATINGAVLQENIEYIHNNFWKYWLHFARNRRLLTLNVNFPFRKLIAIDWERKVMYDRKKVLIKSIDVKLKNSGVEVSNVELITMQ